MAASGDICVRCGLAIRLAPEFYPADLQSAPLLAGAAEWHKFEHQAWAIGEQLRQLLSVHPKLRADAEVQECILSVIDARNLRRGRQSFVMCLSFVAAAPQAGRIAQFLSDPDIAGHVLDALLKMRAPGYSQEVVPLLDSPHRWVRVLAARYIQRFGADKELPLVAPRKDI